MNTAIGPSESKNKTLSNIYIYINDFVHVTLNVHEDSLHPQCT